MKRIHIIIIYLCCISLATSFASVWQREITDYERSQYKAGHQNWDIKESSFKWMYFANSSGLLEYDGANWNLYPIKNKIVRSICIAEEKGRIYAGGSTEFGYYQTDATGKLVYHSLSLNYEVWGGEVWRIYRHKNNVYFVSDGNIHIYNEETGKINMLTTYTLYPSLDCASFIDNRIYIGSQNGVFFLNNNSSLERLTFADNLIGKKIVALLPHEGKIIAVTARDGLFVINNGSCHKLETHIEDFIKKNQLFCATIHNSKIVLGSVQNGAILLDIKDGNIEYYNLETGLTNNTILSVYFDREENLWLGLNRGINHVDLESPIRPLSTKESPIGTGYCSSIYNKTLYLGTNQGLYKVNGNDGLSIIKDSEGQVWSLFEYENTLFSCGDNGIIVITASETYKINIRGAWGIGSMPYDKNRLIVSLYSGFGILEKRAGKWAFSHSVPEFFLSTRGFLVDSSNYTFWFVEMSQDIVYKVTFDRWFSRVTDLKKYAFKNIEFGDNPYIRRIDKTIIVCTKKGIYQYSKVSDNFIRYSELESVLEGGISYGYLDTDALNNIWFTDENNNLKISRYQNGKYTGNITNWGLNNELIEGFQNINLSDSLAVVAVDNAFVQINIRNERERMDKLNIFVRKMVLSNDSIIWTNNTENDIKLPFALNSIALHYVATNHSNSQNTYYSYKLDGLDDYWSAPSLNVVKEYTNLPEGEYTFYVKAFEKENPTQISQTKLTFRILPPWYRSVWALIFYIVSSVMLFIFSLKKFMDKRQKNMIKEKKELLAKNKFIEQENRMKDEEIYRLQNERLQNDLYYKTQELTGYILSLSRKNEMLEEVKKSALGISKTLDEGKEKGVIKQKVLRLITQINANIEHDDDFNVFKSNFDLVHQDFFKRLDEKHPILTRNDKLLCVYLKMNLSSKEIAPLLNISIRGVEVNRYRLRQKLGLERSDNLSEYLQNLTS